jgi:glycerophosphoryl diester phosphodiesterase
MASREGLTYYRKHYRARGIPLNILKSAILCTILLLFTNACSSHAAVAHPSAPADKKLVIAHRGASGYLPEHTLAAKAMAYAQGADYLEQDLVMTSDDELVVLHDHYLDTVTNVATAFPGRSRADGRWYAIDFTLSEIRELSVVERFEMKDGVAVPVFADRFPMGKSSFHVHTFAEEIEMIQGLNMSTGKSVGIYPEIKSPAFHRAEGKDISSAVLSVLQQYGYVDRTDSIFLQCFDAAELRRIHDELMPRLGMSLRLILLMDTTDEYVEMSTAAGIQALAGYVDGIGPSILLLLAPDSTATDIKATPLVEFAHAAGLVVHAYTFRRERDQMPPFAKDYDDFLRIFFDVVKIDGVFTDFPDLTVAYLDAHR